MRIGRHNSVQRKGSGWFAIVAALVLALSWQSVLAQTHDHRHGVSLAETAAHFDSGRHHQGDQSPSHLPAHCLTCRATAHAGLALLPVAVEFAALAQFAAWRAPATLSSPGVTQRSHAWRSRGPPTLQA